ncbi:chorismate-binding protein [Lacinutrix iliipiscaria]|uniref:Chorismate-binding protein n=1 Tax=Lacinutrix iliipiscaria TaxID=1230532 RepID=A0ABW5WNC8_9FLAO
MTSGDFFESLQQHFNKTLPLVVYRKPNSKEVKALLQDNETIHYVNDFSESGFVYSPFDALEKSIVMPLNASEEIKTDFILSRTTETSHQATKYSDAEKAAHIHLVQQGIEAINHKDLQKVVLSRCETVNLSDSHPIEIFKRLMNAYPNAFVYCWCHPKIGLWLGATPETLLKVDGNQFSTMALAGTQKYEDTLEVIWKTKEKEEQQLVTDFITNSLKNLVHPLNVSEPMTLKAGSLLHIKTSISGILKTSLKSVIKKIHPTPAVCGFPKAHAKQFILKHENYNREYYTGFLGELNLQLKQTRNTNRRNVENNAYATIRTCSHLFVNLRCMQLKKQQALIYVGGGITKDSIAENEWHETVNKTQTMKRVLD